VFEQLHSHADTVIGRIVDAAQRHAWPVIAVALVVALVTGYLTVTHITINTDTGRLLSEKLPWRATYLAYKAEFPYFSDTIAIVIDGATADVAADAAAELSDALRAHGDLIEDVFYPQNDAFLRRNQLLYLDPAALQSLADELSAAQPFLARLSAERSTAVLFDLITEAEDRGAADEIAQLAPAMQRIAAAIEEFNTGDIVPMSWQALITDDDEPGALHREIVVVRPHLDYGALLPAAPAIDLIHSIAAELRLDRPNGLEIRLTGGAALSYDELRSVISGSENAGTAATIMVLICLLIGLRSPTLVFAALISLLVGLVYTAGFAVLAVGTLNMISLAFAVLYVGLGVDFAIHICLRYREMLARYSPDNAVNSATRHVGVSLVICALTTAIGFYAFIPTAYRGVAELGLIAGTGMFISLAVSVTLLPALLHVLPAPGPSGRMATMPDWLAAFPLRHARGVLAAAAIAWIGAALMLPSVRFDNDPLNLNDQAAESVVTFRELLRDTDNSPLAIAAMVGSHELARERSTVLRQLPQVGSVRTIDSFVPDDQDEKLPIIDDLALILGADLTMADIPAPDPGASASAIDALLAALQSAQSSDTASAPQKSAAADLSRALEDFRASLAGLGDEARFRAYAGLEEKLLKSFSGRITRLNDGLEPEPFDFEDLPEDIRKRWIGLTGQYRIEIYPQTDLSAPDATKRFVTAVEGAIGDSATGLPVINLGGSKAVKVAFIQAFSYALVIITVLLWLILRSIKEVAFVLSPLILAGLVTAAASVIFSIPFNFANIIALPLLLGIGVDSALHILHRYKTAMPVNGNLLQTSTARAVLFSALTTTVSFGNLAASTHAGTASMGVMLTIGVVSTLICTLLILPAMLQQYLTAPAPR